MRSRYVLQTVIGWAAILLAEPVQAQSIFETLFGGSKGAASPAIARAPSRLLPPGGQAGVNGGDAYTATLPVPRSRAYQDEDAPSSNFGGRTYRTVCVRLCDGFYWPVSFSATRNRFYRDANLCSSSCTSESKLFHFPVNGGPIDDAVDLTGRVYSRLPAAFKYRKALVPSCACKPDPWSEAEAGRHRAYAAKGETGKDIPAVNVSKSAEMPVPPPSGLQETVVVSDAKAADRQSTALQPLAEDVDRQANASKAISAKLTKSTSARAPSVADAPPKRAERSRQQLAPPQPVQSQANAGGFWGGGQAPKYSWPGDGPVRVR